MTAGQGIMQVNHVPVGWIDKERKGKWWAQRGNVVVEADGRRFLEAVGEPESFRAAHRARRLLLDHYRNTIEAAPEVQP